jgi:hypothetical protein
MSPATLEKVRRLRRDSRGLRVVQRSDFSFYGRGPLEPFAMKAMFGKLEMIGGLSLGTPAGRRQHVERNGRACAQRAQATRQINRMSDLHGAVDPADEVADCDAGIAIRARVPIRYHAGTHHFDRKFSRMRLRPVFSERVEQTSDTIAQIGDYPAVPCHVRNTGVEGACLNRQPVSNGNGEERTAPMQDSEQ